MAVDAAYLEQVRKANPEYANLSDQDLSLEIAKQHPQEASRLGLPSADAYLTVGGGPSGTGAGEIPGPSIPSGTLPPADANSWQRLAEIGGKRMGEGAASTLGTGAALTGMLFKMAESGQQLDPNAPETPFLRNLGDMLVQYGQFPVDVWRKIAGPAPTPSTMTESAVGNVGEMVGGAAVPFIGAQGAVSAIGRKGLQMGAREALAAAAQTGAKAQIGMLQRVASMSPAELARVEAYMATGAGLGGTVAEQVTPNPYAKMAGELVGGFGVGGARNLMVGLKEMSGSVATKSGAQRRVGRMLNDVIPPGSQAEQNLGEAVTSAERFGTKPTLATATQSPGAAAIQRQVTQKSPGMAERVAGQQAASEGAIREAGIGVPGTGPGTIEEARTAAATSLAADRAAVEAQAAQLKGQLAGFIDNAGKSVEAQIASLGTIGGREASGEAIVTALKQHEAQARLAAGSLFNRVDPENAVKLPTQGIKDTVGQVMAEGSESLLTNTIPPVVKNLDKKLNEIGGVPKEIMERLQLSPAELKDPRYAAIVQAAGGSEVTFNQLRHWRSDLLKGIRFEASALQPNTEAIRNINRVLESVESTLDQTAALGSDAAIRYRDAASVYKDYVEKFRQGVVADVLRRGPRGEAIRQNVEDIAGSFFTGRAGGPTSSAKDFIAAVGDDALARRGLRDYAIGDFLRSAYDGGQLNTKRASAWFASHKEALAQFPDVEAELRQVMRRGRTYDEVQSFVKGADQSIESARTASLNELDRSAASAFIGADSDRAVAAIMTGQDRQKKMGELVRRMGNDEAALRGLRRAVWDHLAAADFDPTAARPMLDPANLRKRIEDNAAVLRTVYTPEQMTNLRDIARAAELSVKPATATTGAVALAPGELEVKQVYTMQQLFSRGWAAARWASTQFVVADAFARKVTNVFDQLTVPQLRAVYNAAVYDPRVARKLLEIGRRDFNEKQMATSLRGFVVGTVGQAAQD